MRDTRFRARFAIVVVLLLSTGLFLHARRRAENIPRSEKLATFPMQLGPWGGKDVAIDAETLQGLGPGDFLSRIYSQGSGAGYIDLFIAYFSSQKTGDTIHSPRNCLPGSGWTITDSQRTVLNFPGHPPMRVNQYVVGKGPERLLVLYWYQAHGRVTPSEYWAKFYLVADAIRMNRTDGSLVRIVTPIGPDRDMNEARTRAVDFAQRLVPLLSRYIPN